VGHLRERSLPKGACSLPEVRCSLSKVACSFNQGCSAKEEV